MSGTGIVEEQVPKPTPRRDHIPLGILYMIGATVMFAGSSAISKWQVVDYPIGEMLFVRTANITADLRDGHFADGRNFRVLH